VYPLTSQGIDCEGAISDYPLKTAAFATSQTQCMSAVEARGRETKEFWRIERRIDTFCFVADADETARCVSP
jgi:hypothetical protein